MPEFNRNFSQGKMNKDLDERLVPAGQYRDAYNVEVSTSEGSNVGALETLKGNLEQTPGLVPLGSYCVGTIVNNEENCIYYLVAGAPDLNTSSTSDYIIKYNVDTSSATFVFVDKYRVTKNVNAVGISNGRPILTFAQNIGVRAGMTASAPGGTLGRVVSLTDPATGVLSGTIVSLENNSNAVGSALPGDEIVFTSRRILNFSNTRMITGINIVDDLLMFTDNYSEPKKINIKRSIAGTGFPDFTLGQGASSNYHTRLYSRRQDGSFTGSGLEIVRSRFSINEPKYAELEDVTVIKKSPLTPPTLTMSNAPNTDRIGVDGIPNNIFTQLDFGDFVVNGITADPGSSVTLTFNTPVDYRVGDYILLTTDLNAPPTSFVEVDVRLRVTTAPAGADEDNLLTGPFTCEIQSISDDLPDAASVIFNVRLEQDPSLFEFKFPRFGYRYKYVDGEYSPFSPFSEIAFLPGQFEYDPKKGYNLAMANQLRSLQVHNYAPQDYNRPKDIVEIDILYKEEKSPTIYTVKTIKPSDGQPLWPSAANYALAGDNNRGTITIDSELIHAIVPSNQLIRPWDNVPRKALAQEVSANRLIFANYLQNYNLRDIGNSLVTPVINLDFSSVEFTETEITFPRKSLKSMRTYQLGVVYKDEFGRETPVLADKDIGSVTVEKEYCNDINALSATITSNAPRWAKSFKFFLKETAAEYYNLAMCKWYNAEDGNVWISFNSSDRNKVDLDTFLELKKAHDSDGAVEERARYKIIAIENEAPEDIRIDRQQQGAFLNNAANTRIGNANEGFPFSDRNYILLEINEYNEKFGPNVTAIASECSLRIQNGSGSERSEYYDIKNIDVGGAVPGFAKVEIVKKFGPDVNFCSTNDTWDTRISGLTVIIARNKRVNKPEFDGKFFVKIFRDLTLEQYVMVSSDDNYVVDQAFTLGYLMNYPLGGGGNVNYYNAVGWEDNSTLAPLTNPYNPNYTWGDNGWNNADYNGLNSVEQRTLMREDDANGTDTGTQYFNLEFRNQLRVMLDEANAFQWGSGAHWDGDFGGSAEFTYFHNAIEEDWADVIGSPTYRDSVLRNAGGTRQYHPGYEMTPGSGFCPRGSANRNEYGWINGSRGVYENSTGQGFMDFSVFGILQGRYVEDIDLPYDYEDTRSVEWRGFADTAGNDQMAGTTDASRFIERVIGIDTKFRFRADPDKTVYTVKAYREHVGIFNYHCRGGNTAKKRFHRAGNKRVKYTVAVDPSPVGNFDPRTIGAHDGSDTAIQIEFLAPYATEDGFDSDNPAIFETYPKENIELDIYYEIGRAYPITLSKDNDETLALIGDSVILNGVNVGVISDFNIQELGGSDPQCSVDIVDNAGNAVNINGNVGDLITIVDAWGGTVQLAVNNNFIGQSSIPVDSSVHRRSAGDPVLTFGLPWFNCYSFGNGVESNRIRDDFNQPTIQNGVKASTTIAEQYKEERRGNGFIYSGIYNSTAGVNRLNQFIQGEKITKDINPDNGTIQKLFTRNTDIVTFCEDKVIKVLSNKDALFNADGNSNVTATAKVLGAVTPFSGDYGISKNPESFASDQYRCYFTDQQRGAVLRLSKDGLTPISEVGMKDYFTDVMADPLLAGRSLIQGSFDKRKDEYNITFKTKNGVRGFRFPETTISFNEGIKGWSSFKSWIQENGVSINNNYYTFFNGSLWKHHVNSTRNMFYGLAPGPNQFSHVTILFNDMPSSVKNFQTVKYEGSQARINKFSSVVIGGETYTDKEYYNLNAKSGWYVEHIQTDMADGKVLEFINKENKWFNRVFGVCTDLENLDENEFQVQGIGLGNMTHSVPGSRPPLPIEFTIQDSPTDVDGTNWD